MWRSSGALSDFEPICGRVSELSPAARSAATSSSPRSRLQGQPCQTVRRAGRNRRLRTVESGAATPFHYAYWYGTVTFGSFRQSQPMICRSAAETVTLDCRAGSG